MFFFLAGLSMSTRGGYYLLNLIDAYVCTIPIIVAATLEAVGLGWIYGIKRLGRDVKLMLSIDLNLYWKVVIKYITPIIAIIVFFMTILTNSEVVLNNYHYPAWAHHMGYIIVCFCLSPLLIGIFRQLVKEGLMELLHSASQPSKSWKPVFDTEKEQNDYENSQNELAHVNQMMTGSTVVF